MNSASVGPCQFEHVIKVVGDAEEFLLTVVGRSDGVDKKMRFRGGADDVSVAMGSVSKHRTSHVGAMSMMVFRIIAAGAQTQRGAG